MTCVGCLSARICWSLTFVCWRRSSMALEMWKNMPSTIFNSFFLTKLVVTLWKEIEKQSIKLRMGRLHLRLQRVENLCQRFTSEVRCGESENSKHMEKSMLRLHRCRITVNDRFHRLNDGSNQNSSELGSLLWRCGCRFVVTKTLLDAIFTWVNQNQYRYQHINHMGKLWWIESWTMFVWGSTLVRCASRAQHRAIARASGGRCRCQSLQQYAPIFNDFVRKNDENDETTWNCMDHLERTMKVVIGGKARFKRLYF